MINELTCINFSFITLGCVCVQQVQTVTIAFSVLYIKKIIACLVSHRYAAYKCILSSKYKAYLGLNINFSNLHQTMLITCRVDDITSENEVIESIFFASKSISSSIFLKSIFICKTRSFKFVYMDR